MAIVIDNLRITGRTWLFVSPINPKSLAVVRIEDFWLKDAEIKLICCFAVKRETIT
jgi:hypothetical protein